MLKNSKETPPSVNRYAASENEKTVAINMISISIFFKLYWYINNKKDVIIPKWPGSKNTLEKRGITNGIDFRLKRNR